MPNAPDLLQICPYDTAPFGDICRTHSAAARELGWSAQPVFLHSPDRRAEFSPAEDDRYYMDGPEDPAGLHHLRQLKPQKLCLFHRYRSLRVARQAGLKAPAEVLVAHEFGLLDSNWRRLRLRLRERKVALAGVSPAVAAELKSSVVVPNGLDAAEQDRHRVARAVARSHLGVAGDDLVVGVIGRLHRKKNTMLALEGFGEFASSYEGSARLLFVGDGAYRERLQERATDKAIPASFAGFVANAPRYLKAFDLLLFPASSAEAFGMVALEAMLADVPVVASRAPGPNWVLGDGATYFDADQPANVAQALHAAANDKISANNTKSDQLSQRDRAIENFSPQALARTLEKLVAQT